MAKDGTYADHERIHDMRAVTIHGSSISNNVAEMRAVLYGYQYVERYLCGIVTLLSDSRYAIESVNNAHMYDDTSLTWSNILAHRQHSAVELEWRKRDHYMMRLVDFLALLSVASGEKYHWGKPDEHRAVLNAFSTYKPRG
jgi:ribonuclease HI